ncbi:MAG: copper transporter [Firmicutes bacterium]|nr:copper transporter [Bacillota bacterium]
MNFGFRYHVASLVAVFFSLILGILIGGALFPDHVLVDEQATIITELEERFREAQTNLAQLKGEMEAANHAWEQLLETLTGDLLSDQEIVLVDLESGLHPLVNVLKSAGAQVQQVRRADLAPGRFEISDLQNVVFVFPLSQDPLPDEDLKRMDELGLAGANLVYVWDLTTTPSLEKLPPSLQVDSVDTALGQLALLLGISRGSQGHYGRQKDAQRLFP